MAACPRRPTELQQAWLTRNPARFRYIGATGVRGEQDHDVHAQRGLPELLGRQDRHVLRELCPRRRYVGAGHRVQRLHRRSLTADVASTWDEVNIYPAVNGSFQFSGLIVLRGYVVPDA